MTYIGSLEKYIRDMYIETAEGRLADTVPGAESRAWAVEQADTLVSDFLRTYVSLSRVRPGT